MNWTNYFIILSIPLGLIYLTFILAVLFINSNFLKRLFLMSFSFGLIFGVIWVFIGLVAFVVQVVGN